MIGTIIGAGITAGAGLYGNTISANSARAINAANLANQRSMYTEQINLANTAHQREVADLRLAGLNPILSASGNGSASPAAPSVDLQNPDAAYAALGDQAAAAFNVYNSGRNKASQKALLDAQTTNTVATADNTATSAAVAKTVLEERAMRLKWLKDHPKEFDMMMRKEQGLPAFLRGAQSIPETFSDVSEIGKNTWQTLQSISQKLKGSNKNLVFDPKTGRYIIKVQHNGVPKWHDDSDHHIRLHND